jgi:hypothetical protein
VRVIYALTTDEDAATLKSVGINRLLVSYYFLTQVGRPTLKSVEGLSKPGRMRVLDSGAYSAWKRGEEVSRRKLVRYIHRHRDRFDEIVSLDVLPGEPGQARTSDVVDESAEQSYRNWVYMRKEGIESLPVFHQGERWSWLERYLDKADYIGLSPAKDVPHRSRMRWLEQVFTRYESRLAGIRTHGFGVSSPAFAVRFPWYSIDSSAPVMTSGMGIVTLFHKRGKTILPYRLNMTNRSRASLVGPAVRKELEQAAKEAGTTYEDLWTSREARIRVNALQWKKLEDKEDTVLNASRGFF